LSALASAVTPQGNAIEAAQINVHAVRDGKKRSTSVFRLNRHPEAG